MSKCPICNTENPPDAATCEQCGFGLSVARPLWPDAEPLDVPEPQDAPEPAAFEPPAPAPPKDEGARVAGAEDEAVERPDRDALARAHIAKGFRAMREKSFDEARQEFERARELARDPALVRMAQARLDELSKLEEPEPPRPERAEPPRIEKAEPPRPKRAEPPQPREEAPPRRLRRRPAAPPPATLPVETLDWIAAARIGLLLGIANGVLNGCGAIFCVGCVFAPLFGFIAGWQVAGQSTEPAPVSQALIAGAVVGLMGWFGNVVGYLVWLSALSEPFTSELQCFNCFTGGTYTLLTLALSALGWKIKTAREGK